jgi:hypothetical protein
VDLVFYHRRLRCLVLIDLKLGRFTHADAGQMHTYLGYAAEHWTHPGENPPVGLILCAEKDEALARYALGKEQEYIEFLWDAFETNYTHGKYQFAFLAYHMLTMSFVYFNIWQIKQTEPKDFAMGLIGFGRDIEKSLLEATSPFVFSAVNERTILRFLKLIACDNTKIGTYAKLVDDRNETAHPNGNIFFSTEAALDAKITEILRVVDEIQTHSRPVIEHCYREFLLQNHDPDEREYPDAADQIREVLIHGNYLSQKDIEICLGFDIGTLAYSAEIARIRELHDALAANYAVGDAEVAA